MDINFIRSYARKNKGKCLKTAAVALVVILALGTYLIKNLTGSEDVFILEANADEITVEIQEAVTTEEKEVIIVVDIEGAVNDPGIVYLPEGSRVNDAVEKAGGLTDKADTLGVNLAAKLTDGDKVYIPRENEEKKVSSTEPAGIITNNATSSISNSSSTDSAGGTGGGLVNINTANSEQLQTLSGVGPVTAQKIIDYRTSSGGFKKVEDIMKVSGIGTKTYEKLRDKITV